MVDGHFPGCINPEDCWCEVKRYTLILSIAAVILVVEIVGGIISGSLALLADAVHVFVDNTAILISIIIAVLVKRGANEKRVRDRGLYINAFLLGLVVIWILNEAFERFDNPRNIQSMVMIVVAIAGAFGNWIQHKILKGVAHKHHHKTHRALSLHVLSDLFMSVGVTLGAVLIMLTGLNTIDPIISVAIALWISYRTVDLVLHPTGHSHH